MLTLRELRNIKALSDLDRLNLPPVELKGAWWRDLGCLAEPTNSGELLRVAHRLAADADRRMREAKQTGRLTADVEREVLDTLGVVRELGRRAGDAQRREAEERKSSTFDPRVSSDVGRDSTSSLPGPAEAKTYRGLFGKQHSHLSDGEFKSFGEFLRVVTSGRWDPRLDALERKGHVAGVGPLGGFAVPEQWTSFLFDAVVQASAVLPRARVVPMTALQTHVPAWDDLDQSTGTTHGGFAGVWLGEGAEASEQTAKLRLMTLFAHKLAIFTSISRELILGTSGGMEAELRQALTSAVAASLDTAFLTGDAVGKPEGVLTSVALKTVNRATVNAVAYEDLVAVYAGIHPAFAARATFYINPSVLPQLLTMTDGEGRLIWQPSGRDAAPTTLFGRPVVYCDRLPALGSKGDVVALADGSYVVGMLQEIIVDTSPAPEWKRDLVSLRCIVLGDGMLSWNKVYTAPGGATYGTAVALDVPAS